MFDPSSIEDIEKFKDRAIDTIGDRTDLYIVDLVELMRVWYDDRTIVNEAWRLIDYGVLKLTPTLAVRVGHGRED